MKKNRLLILYLFAVLFLVSGAAGLIYQIVWERILGLYFGVTMISITLIVSAFMAGLGIGSLIGGRIARHLPYTLLLYGLLEIGIALFGVISPNVIVWIGETTAGSPYPLVFLISFGILLIPTTLMGMTLPLLTQSFVDRADISGEVIGLLYGINTVGAAFGALLAGYVLIGFYGFEGAVYIAALLNGAVGLCGFVLSRWQLVLASHSPSPSSETASQLSWGYPMILLSSFLVGFIGLGLEMLWIRVLLLVNKNTAYSFPSILFVFLLGLALGGYFWGRRADTSRNPAALFCRLEVAGAVVAVLTFLIFEQTLAFHPPWIADFLETQQPVLPFVESNREFVFSKIALAQSLWDYFLPILIMVFPAMLILGGGLTVLDRLSINNPSLSGRRVGDVHLANIIGSVVGSLVISFILLPFVGSEWTLRLLVLCTFLFPAFYFLSKRANVEKRSLLRQEYLLILYCVVGLLGLFLLPRRGEFYNHLYAIGTGQDVIISESGDSVLALTHDLDHQVGWFWIGGEINSLIPAPGAYEARAMVCAGASQPKRVLVIGFGAGYSTLLYKSIPAVEEIVVVELLGDIAPFLSKNLESARIALSDPRLTYYVDDGRRYLNAFPDEKFDVISVDPLRQHTAGHNNLYSVEAVKLYQQHLHPGGVLCLWMDENHIIPHTVTQVFPYIDQYQNGLIVAGTDPLFYDTGYMQQAADSYAELTGEIYGTEGVILNVSMALDLFRRDQAHILKDEGQMPVLRDMTPLLEYYLFREPTGQKVRENPEAVEQFRRRIVE